MHVIARGQYIMSLFGFVRDIGRSVFKRDEDTLGKIARHYYGNANRYPRIFDANREVIEHPDKIYPGQKIRIPLG